MGYSAFYSPCTDRMEAWRSREPPVPGPSLIPPQVFLLILFSVLFAFIFLMYFFLFILFSRWPAILNSRSPCIFSFTTLSPYSVFLLLCDVQQSLASNQGKLHLKPNIAADRVDFDAPAACTNMTVTVAAISYKDAGTVPV